ncbi:uncharacterized protein LOC120348043 isoform X1 [Styela clava]
MFSVKIDAVDITPAQVEGNSQNVFKSTKFVLLKPKWVSDDSASLCVLCRNKFNQIRRRHHCRCCGLVLCSKCCSNRVPVPQYMIDTPERVCNACLPVVSSVTMSHSNDHEFHERAVSSLELICRDNPASVMSLGGAQTLVYLAKLLNASNMKILNSITACLHTLSLHSGAISWLSEIGVIDAVNHILQISSSASDQPTMATEALNTLRIFVKTSDDLKRKAVISGCVPPLLDLSESDNPFVSLIAMTTLCLIAECRDNHSAILSQKNSLRKLLTKISNSKDEKEVEIILRIMMLMSAGNAETKHMIVCEDSSVGSVMSQVIKSRSSNPQILSNAACAIANLATSIDDQVGLQSSLQAIVSVLDRPQPGYVIVHFVRAFGNFAKHEIHTNTLLANMGNIMKFLDGTHGPKINGHAVKCIFNLLKHRRAETVKQISRFGTDNLILRITEMESVMLELLRSLDREALSLETS